MAQTKDASATFTFTGDPRNPGTDPKALVMFGVEFPFGAAVEVTDKTAIAKLRRHNHFTETKSE